MKLFNLVCANLSSFEIFNAYQLDSEEIFYLDSKIGALKDVKEEVSRIAHHLNGEDNEWKKFPSGHQAKKTFYNPDDIAKGIKRDEDEKGLCLENVHTKTVYYPKFTQEFDLRIFDIFN